MNPFRLAELAARGGISPRALALAPSSLSAAALAGAGVVQQPDTVQQRPHQTAAQDVLLGYALRDCTISGFNGPLAYNTTVDRMRAVFDSLEQGGISPQKLISASGAANAALIPGALADKYRYLGVRLETTVTGDGAPGPKSQSLAVVTPWGETFTMSWTLQPKAGIPAVMNLLIGRVGIVGQNKPVQATSADNGAATTSPSFTAGGTATDVGYIELIGPGNPRFEAFLGSLVTGVADAI